MKKQLLKVQITDLDGLRKFLLVTEFYLPASTEGLFAQFIVYNEESQRLRSLWINQSTVLSIESWESGVFVTVDDEASSVSSYPASEDLSHV